MLHTCVSVVHICVRMYVCVHVCVFCMWLFVHMLMEAKIAHLMFFFVFCCISLRQDLVSLSWKLEVLARLGQLAFRGYRHMQPAHSLAFSMEIRDLISDTHAWTTSTLIL